MHFVPCTTWNDTLKSLRSEAERKRSPTAVGNAALLHAVTYTIKLHKTFFYWNRLPRQWERENRNHKTQGREAAAAPPQATLLQALHILFEPRLLKAERMQPACHYILQLSISKEYHRYRAKI